MIKGQTAIDQEEKPNNEVDNIKENTVYEIKNKENESEDEESERLKE